EAFHSLRSRLPARAGEVGAVREEQDSFVVFRLNAASPSRLSFDRYSVAKITWEQWLGSQPGIDVDEVRPVAESVAIPFPDPAPAASVCRPADSWAAKSRDEDPSVRVQHTAVWTGREMIVWGGYGPDGIDQHTGGRYDPLTDSWTPTSQVNAPTAARGHTAVWTGSEMIIAIGTNFGTSGRYNPMTDTWRPVSTVGAPTAMRNFSATWIGTQMFTPGALYNPLTDTWTSINPDLSWDGYVAIWTGRYVLLLLGRADASGFAFSRYEPAAHEWTTLSTPPIQGRGSFSTVWTGSRMIVWGGIFGMTNPQPVNTGGVYDPVKNSWSPTSTTGASSARYRHTAVWSGNRMIVWGGNAGNAGGGATLNTGGSYDPATDTWSPVTAANPPLQRDSHTAVWTGSLMIVWGGLVGHSVPNETEQINNGARYDPVANTWTPTSPGATPLPRTLHAGVWTGTQMIVWGGQTILPFAGYQRTNTGGRYDPILEDWSSTTTTNAPSGRSSHVAVWTGSRMIVWGGQDATGAMVGDGARYDPVADSWTTMATGPAPRTFANAVWTGTRMILWGGEIPGGGPDGALYDPNTNTWSAMANSPMGPRVFNALAWTGTQMAVWGGEGRLGGPFESTGALYKPQNNSWTSMSTINAPPASNAPGGVWTGSEVLIWPGGPANTNAPVARLDPKTNTWTYGSSTNAPYNNGSGFAAVWSGSDMVLWGEISPPSRYNRALDIWTTMMTVGEPIRRHNHTSLWTGTEMLIWGGERIFGYLGDSARYAPAQVDADFDGDGFTACGGDCDDNNAAIHPGATEVCNGVDDNCNGVRDEGFPDADGDGFTACGGDCDDTNPLVHPGVAEICNGLDDNCVNGIDEGFDRDGDGVTMCGGDCNDVNPAVGPFAVEICNGIDDNCNGAIDEGGDAQCADANACTNDACGGANGCINTSVSDGTPCASGNACLVNTTCSSGACQGGVLKDSDADAHPDAACGGDDCNDADASVWHAAFEVANVTVGASSPSAIAWDSQAASAGPETTYDVASGLTPTLGGGYQSPVCLSDGGNSAGYDDGRPAPPLNQVIWYLVRARNSCGAGDYGSGSNGVPRAIGACP
ncbi:MAG TPA: MopE-related protein, partial [Candidatus Polarisedimenticolia bacterium]|nr:MopE-related protein [Candidatus Polarisedimenticolia bacterium]